MPAGVTCGQGLQPLDPDRFFRAQRHQYHPFRVLFAHRPRSVATPAQRVAAAAGRWWRWWSGCY